MSPKSRVTRVRMAPERHKGPYPKGTRSQMTPEWKQAVRDALKKKGWDQVDLAEAIKPKVHKTAITKMFQAQSSKLVDKICVLLEIDPPMIATPAPVKPDAFMDLAAQVPEENRAIVSEILRKFIPPE